MKNEIVLKVCVLCLLTLSVNTFAQDAGYWDAYNFGYDMIMEPFLEALNQTQKSQDGSLSDKNVYEQAFNSMLTIAAYGYFSIIDDDTSLMKEDDQDGDGIVYAFENYTTDIGFLIANVNANKVLVCVLSNNGSLENSSNSKITVYNLYNKNQKQQFVNAYNNAKTSVISDKAGGARR